MNSPLLTKTPKSQLSAEQLAAKNGGTYQKRYPTSKEATTREYEGHNHDKIKFQTSQVSDPQTGKFYHRSSPTKVKVLSPISGSSAPGVWQWEEEVPENLPLKASGV